MMPQVTAAALVSGKKVLSHPASVDSITLQVIKKTSFHGHDAAIKLKKVVENTRNTLAIEAMAAAQAIDFLARSKARSPLPAMRNAGDPGRVRDHDKDRVMYQDFARIAE